MQLFELGIFDSSFTLTTVTSCEILYFMLAVTAALSMFHV